MTTQCPYVKNMIKKYRQKEKFDNTIFCLYFLFRFMTYLTKGNETLVILLVKIKKPL